MILPIDKTEVPSAMNHEARLLSCIALDALQGEEHGCFRKAKALGVNEDSFYKVLHRRMWVAAENMDGTFDELTMAIWMRDHEEECDTNGLIQDLTEVLNSCETTFWFDHWLEVVLETQSKREYRHIGMEVAELATKGATTDEMADVLEKKPKGVMASTGLVNKDATARAATQRMLALKNSGKNFLGLSTGIDQWDQTLYGLRECTLNIVGARPGLGKCLGQGTKVVMFDGSLKCVEDIIPGDKVMGPDSNPRNVLSTTKGFGDLYTIHQNKAIDYVVNDAHVLSLKASGDEGTRKHGDIVNIKVTDFLNKSKKYQIRHKGWKVGWESSNAQCLPIGAYFLGVWLGDGTSSSSSITNSDPEIIEFCKNYADWIGHKCRVVPDKNTFRISITKHTRAGGSQAGCLQKWMRQLGILNNKHIPDAYLQSSKEVRSRLLAGLLDTDGHLNNYGGFEITQKNERLARQIKLLADSLGLKTSINSKVAKIKSIGFSCEVWRVQMSGDFSPIPLRVFRKKPTKPYKGTMQTGIKVTPKGKGEYFGFQLDGDHLFLLEDGTVTHNSSIALQVALNIALQNQRVHFWSCEMSPEQLHFKLALSHSQTDWQKAKDGILATEQLRNFEYAANTIAAMPIEIPKETNITTKMVAGLLHKDIALNSRENRPKLVIIDYLQLMIPTNRALKRDQQIEEMSRDLKNLALDTGVPILLLAQINRDAEKENRNPRPSDLRGSGAIEQDADTITFLHTKNGDDPMSLRLIVAKNREDSTGECVVTFNKRISKIY